MLSTNQRKNSKEQRTILAFGADRSTTLDLSQKAEKRYPKMPAGRRVFKGSLPRDMVVINTSPPEALARAIRATP